MSAAAADRGFVTGPATEHLDGCAAAFLAGARTEAQGPADPHVALAAVEPWYRGFAYEGAAMSAALVDLLVPGSRRLPLLLDGPGHGYRHLVHVGAGWALPRQPRRSLSRRLGLDPLLRWLVQDGTGFRRSFFAPAGVRLAQLAEPAVGGVAQLRMHGAGRALWFVCGADLHRVASAVSTAAPANRGPLWAGVGLAAAYAGSPGLDVDRLTQLAGPFLGRLRQGAVFGSAARASHDAVTPGEPCRVLVGWSSATCRDRCDEEADRLVAGATAPLPSGTFRRWQQAFESVAVAA